MDADAPSLASTAFSLASPSREVDGDGGVFSVDSSVSSEVLQDGDLLCLVFQHILAPRAPA